MSSRRSTSDGEPADPDDSRPAVVLPLLANEGDRRVLQDWIEDRPGITPVVDAAEEFDGESFDCVIVDRPSFERYHEALVDRKTGTDAILPYLFVKREERRPISPAVAEYVDDVVSTPIDLKELSWRVDVALEMRDLSTDLLSQYDRLEHLVGAVTHDLRNPLGIAQGYIERLEDTEDVAVIADALDRMDRLVEQILAMNRYKNGVGAADREPIALARIARESATELMGEDTSIEVTVDDGVRVEGARLLVRQIFENLFRNAMEHPDAPVGVRVGTLPDGEGFFIEDDGPGIPKGERNQVFEEGFSTEAGNGLGLSIVRGAAESHGWTVDVTESEAGGARFEFRDVALECVSE
jgi:signal transduction histidine kinase